MKAPRTAVLVLPTLVGLLLSVGASTPQADDAGVRLRAAIEKEEVDGDLEAAIGLYQKIVADNGGNRAVAAKALLRLGGCYEKLGQGQARRTYQRLVAEYPEQQQEVAAARQRLAALPAEAQAAAPGPTFRRIQIPGKPVRRSGAMLSPDGTRFAFDA
jgi:tetratricopeptide (TPR) repeat protein